MSPWRGPCWEEEALANIADAVREYMEVAVENAAGMMIREIEVAV